MPELLFEIMSEEIPARMQARAAADHARLVCKGLDQAGLGYGTVRHFATPRRLSLVIDDLVAAQPDLTEERRGPRVDAREQAVEGFLGAVGLSRDQLEERETPKGTFLFAVIERKGRPTADILSDVLVAALADFPWPKSMRWGTRPERWVRPVHSVLALFDGDVVPLEFAGCAAGNASVGHRFHAPDRFRVSGFSGYAKSLAEAKVMLDPAERRTHILQEATRLAEAEGYRLLDDPGLLDEIVGLVEWPVVLVGEIDEAFLDVPMEVLVTSMKSHQKYFSMCNADGTLAPRFVVVANLETQDGGRAIVAGNERVLKARLSDARFFWNQDRAHSLASRLHELERVVFHARLGSLGDKARRVRLLSVKLARAMPGAELAAVERAAELCKADLVTGMVGEFPELQGVMGRYYALHDGEAGEVAEAIADHYAPRGPSDRCPVAPASVAVALAEKLDTLAGFFAIDERPTGSKDPFALRRAALGAIRLILENGVRLSLREAFAEAQAGYEEPTDDDRVAVDVVEGLLDFFADRLKVHLRERGVRHDLISAVFALGHEDDLVRLIARVEALAAFLQSDDGANLLTAYRRAANIVRIEENRDGVRYDGAADMALVAEAEEKSLAEKLPHVTATSAEAAAAEDFGAAMAALATLRGPIDDFFDKVTVNADDPALRQNRLRLLSQIGATLGAVADFSHIEG